MSAPEPRLPPPAPECRLTVCVPARNEAPAIGAALEALRDQRDLRGRPLPANAFDVIVLANNSSDDTAGAVRRFALHAARPVYVVETTFAPARAHIGTARKAVMDLAAARFLRAKRPGGIVASIDSDTIAAADWVAAIEAEIAGRDAVAGHVTIARADHDRLLAPLRLLYARELAYRRILAEVEAVVDPLPEDPAPRHGSFVGASFAVTAAAYRAAGGIPPRPRLEDLAFARALKRIDARVRHSLLVRATTSARRDPRVAGGFGSFIAELDDCARRGDSFLVENPLRSLEDFEIRAALRRLRRGMPLPGDIARTAAILNAAPDRWLPEIDGTKPAGDLYERIAGRAERGRAQHADVAVEIAIEALRRGAAAARSSARIDAGAEAAALRSLHAG